MWANGGAAAPTAPLNPPLGPSRFSSHSKRRQSAAWEFTHCLPWRSRQWPSTVWWDVFPPVPGQVLGAVARAQTTDSGRIFADAARTDFLPKQICFTKLTNNVEKKSIVRIKSIDISKAKNEASQTKQSRLICSDLHSILVELYWEVKLSMD